MIDSQMTCADPSSYGSQNCSQQESQASIVSEDPVALSQHRNQLNAMRSTDRFETPMTPINRNDERSIAAAGMAKGTGVGHRPPKAPTWNASLIKRAASPVSKLHYHLQAY